MPARAKSPFLKQVAGALQRVPLREGERVLVALSGGPDSVALLHAMLKLRGRFAVKLAAAHLNHRLRGEESERDEAFVRELCARLQVELFVERAAAAIAGGNLEERAREVRHEFLKRAARRCGAAHIALAHQLDDQAETVLMRLMRGAGVAGLAAMAPVDPRRRLIRPLLSLTRAEIGEFLKSIGARYVIDSSNSSAAIERNRIRNRLLPMLELECAPGLARRLAALASEARALDGLMAALARREIERMGAGRRGADLSHAALEVAALMEMPAALGDAVLREFIRLRTGDLRRIARVHIAALRRLAALGPPSGKLSLPGGWMAARSYGKLEIFRPLRPAERCAGVLNAVPIKSRGLTCLGYGGIDLRVSRFEANGAVRASNLMEAMFDDDLVKAGLEAAVAVKGQRVAPIGMRGHRKLQDVFVDNRVPRKERQTWPVVMFGEEVAWVPGLMRARVALVSETTRRVLRIQALPSPSGRAGVVAPK